MEFNQIYQLKISLSYSKPIIWRRVQVPDNYSFYQLHVVIQNAMGWEDYHLHQFTAVDSRTGATLEIGCIDKSEEVLEVIDEQEVKLYQIFSNSNKKVLYEYDFGDGWEHSVILEKILPVNKELEYPVCIEGKQRCPPEDCGGVWGYAELLEVLSNPDHPEYKETVEWIGGKFDPNDFAPSNVVFDKQKLGSEQGVF